MSTLTTAPFILLGGHTYPSTDGSYICKVPALTPHHNLPSFYDHWPLSRHQNGLRMLEVEIWLNNMQALAWPKIFFWSLFGIFWYCLWLIHLHFLQQVNMLLVLFVNYLHLGLELIMISSSCQQQSTFELFLPELFAQVKGCHYCPKRWGAEIEGSMPDGHSCWQSLLICGWIDCSFQLSACQTMQSRS